MSIFNADFEPDGCWDCTCAGASGFQVGLLASAEGPPGVASAFLSSNSSDSVTRIHDQDISRLQVSLACRQMCVLQFKVVAIIILAT